MRFERRNIIVRTMEVNDVSNYYYQFSKLSKLERNSRIRLLQKQLTEMENNIDSTLVLVVEEKESHKLIGTIYGNKKDEVEELSISIPNEYKLLRYGFEVIDQFLKICKEEWPQIKVVKLNRKNPATEIYMKERNLDTEYITVA